MCCGTPGSHPAPPWCGADTGLCRVLGLGRCPCGEGGDGKTGKRRLPGGVRAPGCNGKPYTAAGGDKAPRSPRIKPRGGPQPPAAERGKSGSPPRPHPIPRQRLGPARCPCFLVSCCRGCLRLWDGRAVPKWLCPPRSDAGGLGGGSGSLVHNGAAPSCTGTQLCRAEAVQTRCTQGWGRAGGPLSHAAPSSHHPPGMLLPLPPPSWLCSPQPPPGTPWPRAS